MRVIVTGDPEPVAHHAAVDLVDGYRLMLCGLQQHATRLEQVAPGGRTCVVCAEYAALPGPGRRAVRT